jgi:hypothetical protein
MEVCGDEGALGMLWHQSLESFVRMFSNLAPDSRIVFLPCA